MSLLKTLLAALTLASCLSAQTLPINAKSWYSNLSGSKGNTYRIQNIKGGGIELDFPQSINPLDTMGFVLGALFHNFTTPTALTGTVTAQIGVTAQPGVIFVGAYDPTNTCPYLANTRLYFTSGDFIDPNGRWFAQANYVLANGTATLSVPLDPALWGNAAGQSGSVDPAAFYAAAANVVTVGVVMGNGCFAGHGVAVYGGTATFQLLGYSVTQ